MRAVDGNNPLLNTDVKAFTLTNSNAALRLIAGMTIKGEVSSITKDLLSILTDKGDIISLPYKSITGIMVSDILSFNVEKGENGLFFTPKTSEDILKGAFIQSALKDADLKPTAENKQMVVKLMENGLNIDKDTLQNASFYLSKLPDKHFDTALMLLKNNVPKSALLNESVIDFLSGDVKLLNNFSKGLERFFNSLSNDNVKSEISNLFIKELNNAYFDKKPSIPIDFKPLNIALTPDSISSLPDRFSDMVKELAAHHENSKEFLQLASKNPIELFEKLADGEALKALQNKYSELNIKPKDIMEKVFSKLFTDFKNEESIPPLEKNLETIKAALSETITKLPDNIKQESAQLIALEKSLTFADNLKNPLVIPFVWGKERDKAGEGELFIFKDKNANKKNNNVHSAYLSIDFSALGRVDSYIVSENKSVNIAFTISKENIKLFKKNMEILNEDLKRKGYSLTSVTYKDEFTKPFLEDTGDKAVITNLTIDIKM